MAGQLKRENPDIQEDLVLIRALRDSNLPKFLADDAILFKVSDNTTYSDIRMYKKYTHNSTCIFQARESRREKKLCKCKRCHL